MIDQAYKDWLTELKQKVRSAQLKAAVAVNATLIEFYFDLGRSISEKQTHWGSGFLKQLSQDLRNEFSKMEGFSETNLKYCRLFFHYVQNGPQAGDTASAAIRPQAEDELLLSRFKQIPWGQCCPK